jgi:TIGR03009 family protein
LDQILVAWQQATSRVKTFQADFIRYEYDLVFGRPDQPTTVEKGQVAFAAPDRGLFSVDGPQPEKWLCDGKTLYEYDFKAKLLTEHKLPPALQGSAIPDIPPIRIFFGLTIDLLGLWRPARIFGTPPGQLKQQYYVRAITPKAEETKTVWLQFLPRLDRDKANLGEIALILDAGSFQPRALRVYLPGGKTSFSFVFENARINDPHGLQGKPFEAATPLGWLRTVDDALQMLVTQHPSQGGGR